MLKPITAALLSLVLCTSLSATDYDDAWKAIHQKRFKEAQELLMQAAKNPATALDASLTILYLQTYQGKETKIDGLADVLSQNPDKNPYLYSLWFNGAMVGQYNKKQPYQLAMLNKILGNNSFNGSLQSAAHYVKGMHYVFSHEFGKAKEEWSNMGALNDWQLTGPFENLSGSGFNNTNGPITSADNKTAFKAANNVEVAWFTPAVRTGESWVFTYANLPQSSAIIYAQTFVNAPEDMKVLINAGGSGSLKIWVNDGLVLSDAKERTTELDYYKNYCQLHKGYNRILVQLGYTASIKPNYIVRLTDDQLMPVKGITSTSQLQPYVKAADAPDAASIKHFAEAYFEQKITADATNLVNYILLSQTYLRDERTTEARHIIEKALALSPGNPLLKFELIQCLLKADNRTLLLQEVEWIKENDPESFFNYQIKVNNLISEEKYADADEVLSKMKALFGEDAYTLKTKITLLGKQEKVEDLLKLINSAYASYPDNVSFVTMMFYVKKQAMKDAKGALAVYEKYLKSNYNYDVSANLSDEYKEQGMTDKYLGLLKETYDLSGYDPTYASRLSKFYYEQQNYAKSMDYAQQALKLAPYSGQYWNNLANIQDQMNKKDDAIASLKKAIYFDRTNYDARKKLSTLEQKADLYKQLPDVDVYAQIKKTPVDHQYDYSYVEDDKGTIIYDEGASEEYIHYAVKINTQKGIDSWKEINLGYDDNTQSLLVEKCEVVKANGSKVPAERNGSQVVFTGLEAGDAIHVKYRIQNYSRGRLGREFWDKFNFNAFVPSLAAKYTLIVPKNFVFTSKVANAALAPTVKEVDEYKMYQWQTENLPALKSESYMPPLNDVGTVLHISTLKSWAEVANWYSDISYQNVTDNFELNEAFNEIFPDNKPLTNLQKAKRIYEYMLGKLRYSSVSFRQSGFVPQEVAKIISTRLGDCKDFSTLFAALAAKAGIPAQLVLVDTRDKGSKDMMLPSMEFNHCIVLAKIDGRDQYLELTDNNLAFGSLPNNLNGALTLLIPPHGQKSTEDFKPLVATTRTKDRLIRSIDVTINGKDEKLAIEVKRSGHLASGWRDEYATLPEEKQMENYEKSISNGYKNPVKLESLSWMGLKDLSDSLQTNYVYTVKNEVIEAGSMRMIKIPFIDLVATIDNFSSDKRDFPIEYWNYENTDLYETTVKLQLPAGQKFVEVPVDQNLRFKNSVYSIRYVKEGEKLKIIRSAKMQRENIPASDYTAFKKFFNDIVEAESKYIVFK